MTDYNYRDADHLVRMKQGLCRSYRIYHSRCIVLKEMPDQRRYKIVVFGWRGNCRPPNDELWRIKYVHKSRVTPIKNN